MFRLVSRSLFVLPLLRLLFALRQQSVCFSLSDGAASRRSGSDR